MIVPVGVVHPDQGGAAGKLADRKRADKTLRRIGLGKALAALELPQADGLGALAEQTVLHLVLYPGKPGRVALRPDPGRQISGFIGRHPRGPGSAEGSVRVRRQPKQPNLAGFGHVLHRERVRRKAPVCLAKRNLHGAAVPNGVKVQIGGLAAPGREDLHRVRPVAPIAADAVGQNHPIRIGPLFILAQPEEIAERACPDQLGPCIRIDIRGKASVPASAQVFTRLCARDRSVGCGVIQIRHRSASRAAGGGWPVLPQIKVDLGQLVLQPEAKRLCKERQSCAAGNLVVEFHALRAIAAQPGDGHVA